MASGPPLYCTASPCPGQSVLKTVPLKGRVGIKGNGKVCLKLEFCYGNCYSGKRMVWDQPDPCVES